MKPFLAKGYAKRKLHTGNQSVQFDEEVEVGRPLLYSTICGSFLRIMKSKPDVVSTGSICGEFGDWILRRYHSCFFQFFKISLSRSKRLPGTPEIFNYFMLQFVFQRLHL